MTRRCAGTVPGPSRSNTGLHAGRPSRPLKQVRGGNVAVTTVTDTTLHYLSAFAPEQFTAPRAMSAIRTRRRDAEVEGEHRKYRKHKKPKTGSGVQEGGGQAWVCALGQRAERGHFYIIRNKAQVTPTDPHKIFSTKQYGKNLIQQSVISQNQNQQLCTVCGPQDDRTRRLRPAVSPQLPGRNSGPSGVMNYRQLGVEIPRMPQ